MKLNNADKTLLAAWAVFGLTLWLKLRYPGTVWIEGLFFASEAALVGGIADWFAVTALFRKPLGVPWHTALLPKRRPEFSQAAIKMIRQEFLSRQRIFRHIEKLHLLPMLLNWLEQADTKRNLCQKLQNYLENFLRRQNTAEQANLLAAQISHNLRQADLQSLFAKFGRAIVDGGQDHHLLHHVAEYLQKMAAADSTKTTIRTWLENFEREKTQSPWEMLLAGLAEAFDFVNLDEAAELLQAQLVKSLQELGEKDSPLQREILSLFRAKAAELNSDAKFQAMADNVRCELIDELPLNEIIAEAVEHFRRRLLDDAKTAQELNDLLMAEYDRMLILLNGNNLLHRDVYRFVYDIVARTALHAQSLVGPIVEEALTKLTDEELNHLVADKVEPDLVWIRINGSLVGFVVGIFLFVCFHFSRLV